MVSNSKFVIHCLFVLAALSLTIESHCLQDEKDLVHEFDINSGLDSRISLFVG